MADFRKPSLFLIKCTALLAIVMISYLTLLYVCVATSQDRYLAATLDKMKLLEDTPSPKIIFVGGSNLAFGIDSSKVRQAFAMPVVNMGLQRGLGLKFMLDQVDPFLKRGDVVVIVPEYGQFTGDLFYGELSYLIEIAALTNKWSILVDKPILTLSNAFLKNNSLIFNYKNKLGVSRNWFNQDGDVTFHLTLPNWKFPKTDQLDSNINPISVQYLHNFIRAKKDRGIICFVDYPCLERSYYLDHFETISIIAKALISNGIPTLSSPEDRVYDEELFFNSIYHLNAIGRELRTFKMIAVLNDQNLMPSTE